MDQRGRDCKGLTREAKFQSMRSRFVWVQTEGKGHTWAEHLNRSNIVPTTLCWRYTVEHVDSKAVATHSVLLFKFPCLIVWSPFVSYKPRPHHNAPEVNNWQRIIMESLNVLSQRHWLMCRSCEKNVWLHLTCSTRLPTAGTNHKWSKQWGKKTHELYF